MAASEIFISYKSQRRNAAEHFADVLLRNGYSVWYDYELVKGHDFGPQIERKIREAKAVVVLWCSLSVESRWVTEEAHLAFDLGTIIPVKIEPCDLPMGFRRQEFVDLTTWDGNPRGHQLDELIEALERKVGRPAQVDNKALRNYANIWRRFGSPSLSEFTRSLSSSVEPDRNFFSPRPTALSWARTSPQPTIEEVKAPRPAGEERQAPPIGDKNPNTTTRRLLPDPPTTKPAVLVDVRVPSALGESVDEATLTRWLKKLGEVVTEDEPLLELDTEKVTIEVPAPANGTLVQVLVEEGDVRLNALLGRIAKR